MVWSIHADDAKMLLDIPFPMNYVTIDQLALNLIYVCLHNTLQILWKSFLCFTEIGKIDYSKIAKIWLVKFCMFNFEKVYLTQLLTDFKNLYLKISVAICLSKIKEILKIRQKTFVLFLMKRRYFFGDTWYLYIIGCLFLKHRLIFFMSLDSI